MMMPEPQRLGAGGAPPTRVATAMEDPPRQQSHRHIVLNQEYAFAASAPRLFGLESVHARSGGSNGRQKYLGGGSFADLGGHLDPTLVLLDDAINRGQSAPGAPAARLRSKERLQDLLD